jgi:hypothetical protein
VSQSIFDTLKNLYLQKIGQLTVQDVLDALTQNNHISATEQQELLQIQKSSKKHRIFISYRRKDTRWFTRQLQENFHAEFPDIEIFWDLELQLGIDFTKAIEDAVSQCTVFLAVIGNDWLTIQDDKGNRRIDNPNDFVRLEIATALVRPIRIIPILVDSTPMPQEKDLPDDLRDLCKLQALDVDEKRFRHDVNVLLHELRQIFT